MPKSKSAAVATAAPALPLCEKADALFRFAAECCRQHRRYACLVDHDVSDSEQQAALRLVAICDELLLEHVEAYEKRAANEQQHREESWFRRANALWMASREYARRHRVSDMESRRLAAHDARKLGRLTLEYDLEASALLALKQAIDEYRAARPEAELNGMARPQSA